nr:ribonuclease H-like domain-containing protein [Tanacetum cinerariifolium]
VQDYALWDVIGSGNSFVPVTQTTITKGGDITITMSGPMTAEEKIKKKNDVKERSILLMALSNEHLMTFNQHKDAKSLFVAIKTRFGGNEAIKKTQKTLLKQMYRTLVLQAQSLLTLFLTGFRKLNKPDLETMSIDDLYKNFKIVKQKVTNINKRTKTKPKQNRARNGKE